MSYTYAVLRISKSSYDEIRQKLAEAGCEQAFHKDGSDEVIDMHGIALGAESIVSSPVCECGHSEAAHRHPQSDRPRICLLSACPCRRFVARI